ncbi:hypothetical protein D3C80_1630890 [compost metagenome]
MYPGALDLQLGADGIAQFDVEALQAAISGNGLKGRVFGVDAEADFSPFLGLDTVYAQRKEQHAEELAQRSHGGNP